LSTESETGADGQTVPWWTPPGETDTTAFAALILLFLLVFAVFHFYARFDRYAERQNEGTPLKTTIPTLLMIAFAYEIFPPLSHFSILLPLALIATALARDLMLWFEPRKQHALKGELEDMLAERLAEEHKAPEPKPPQQQNPKPQPAPPKVQAKSVQPPKAAASSRQSQKEAGGD